MGKKPRLKLNFLPNSGGSIFDQFTDHWADLLTNLRKFWRCRFLLYSLFWSCFGHQPLALLTHIHLYNLSYTSSQHLRTTSCKISHINRNNTLTRTDHYNISPFSTSIILRYPWGKTDAITKHASKLHWERLLYIHL